MGHNINIKVMRTPDEILKDVGIDVETLKRENRELYDSIRKAMDEFADQYAEWRVRKLKLTLMDEIKAYKCVILNLILFNNINLHRA
jgi:hypothetical protein